jgi:cobalt-zinc-cadmium efflux system outer membrane protein
MKRLPFSLRKSAGLLLSLALGACARYRPDPLPTAPDLQKTPELIVPAKQFWLPGIAPHPVSPQGLDETTVMTLAVFNNPDLKTARLQAGVAGAQMLEAGLLPDPEIDANFATSALNYGGVLGLNEQIQALITRGAAKAAAKNAAQQVNLDILWQEWQVAERARELFIQIRADQQLQSVFSSSSSLLADRYHRDQAAMRHGDETAGVVAADLNAFVDADTNLRQLQTEMNVNRHALNALLGVDPEVSLHLIGPAAAPALTHEEFDQALAALPQRRADLLALQAGYQSQEESLRRAILAQFPAMSAGVDFERDPVEGVNSLGPQVSMTLPLFNRNRGQIAIQKATRRLLRQTYQARLDAAQSQADEMWKAAQILDAQVKQLDAELPQLRQTAAAARQSLQEYNVNAPLYITLESNLLARRAQAIRLRASLQSARCALHTLLGLPLPTEPKTGE